MSMLASSISWLERIWWRRNIQTRRLDHDEPDMHPTTGLTGESRLGRFLEAPGVLVRGAGLNVRWIDSISYRLTEQ